MHCGRHSVFRAVPCTPGASSSTFPLFLYAAKATSAASYKKVPFRLSLLVSSNQIAATVCLRTSRTNGVCVYSVLHLRPGSPVATKSMSPVHLLTHTDPWNADQTGSEPADDCSTRLARGCLQLLPDRDAWCDAQSRFLALPGLPTDRLNQLRRENAYRFSATLEEVYCAGLSRTRHPSLARTLACRVRLVSEQVEFQLPSPLGDIRRSGADRK